MPARASVINPKHNKYIGVRMLVRVLDHPNLVPLVPLHHMVHQDIFFLIPPRGRGEVPLMDDMCIPPNKFLQKITP